MSSNSRAGQRLSKVIGRHTVWSVEYYSIVTEKKAHHICEKCVYLLEKEEGSEMNNFKHNMKLSCQTVSVVLHERAL